MAQFEHQAHAAAAAAVTRPGGLRLAAMLLATLAVGGCETVDSIGEQVGGWFQLDPPSPTAPTSTARTGSGSSSWPPLFGGGSAEPPPAAQPAPPSAVGQPLPPLPQSQGLPPVMPPPAAPAVQMPLPQVETAALPPSGAAPGAVTTWSGLQEDLARSSGDRIFFGANATELSPRAQEILVWQAGWLRRNPLVSVTLIGHADDKGTPDQNLILGQRRAEAAKKYLVALGIPAARIETVSFGSRRPFATGTDAAAKALNRRVVAVVNPN